MRKNAINPLRRVGVLAAVLWSVSIPADQEVLERFVGTWDIHANTLQPAPTTARYTETYEWVLDRQFIRGQTGRKADGSYDIIFGTYDSQADGYPFWMFSSAGSHTYLPPANWDARKQIMTWKNPRDWDINYSSQCHFPERDRRDCHLIMKDWKGKVLIELEWQAHRRAD